MSFRARVEWVFRMGLLVFILAAAAFLSAITAMRFAVQGREVSMPNLVGKSSAEAQAILQGRGLQLKVVDRVYSDLPVNAVARQSPPRRRAHEKFSECARGAQPWPTHGKYALVDGRILARCAHPVAASRPATGRSDLNLLFRSFVRHNPAANAEARNSRGKPARRSPRCARDSAGSLRDALACRHALA